MWRHLFCYDRYITFLEQEIWWKSLQISPITKKNYYNRNRVKIWQLIKVNMVETLEPTPVVEPIPALELAPLLVRTPMGKEPEPESESFWSHNILQNILRSRFQAGISLSSNIQYLTR